MPDWLIQVVSSLWVYQLCCSSRIRASVVAFECACLWAYYIYFTNAFQYASKYKVKIAYFVRQYCCTACYSLTFSTWPTIIFINGSCMFSCAICWNTSGSWFVNSFLAFPQKVSGMYNTNILIVIIMADMFAVNSKNRSVLIIKIKII